MAHLGSGVFATYEGGSLELQTATARIVLAPDIVEALREFLAHPPAMAETLHNGCSGDCDHDHSHDEL